METRICCKCRKEKDLRKFKIKINGKRATGCMECNDTAKIYAERGKCPHEERKSQCRECGGASICTHGRQKWTCRECGGTSICTHGRQKSKCRDCGGDHIRIVRHPRHTQLDPSLPSCVWASHKDEGFFKRLLLSFLEQLARILSLLNKSIIYIN